MLKASVAKAGGTESHVQLFKLLLGSSITGHLPDSQNSIQFQDVRALSALLFTLPAHIQILLSLMIVQREKEIFEQFKNKYTLVSNIPNAAEIIYINQGVTQTPMGPTVLSILNRPTSVSELDLMFGLGLKTKIFNSEIPFRKRLEELFNTYNLYNEFIEELISLAIVNDRLKSAIYISSKLGYSSPNIQNISNVVEIWLLENSSI